MPERTEPLLRYIRRLVSRPASAPDTDAALLARFTRERDEAAFAALVARHGRMVLGVCRRVLRDHQAAEDAAQATWLVLARKASVLRRPEGVGRLVARARVAAAIPRVRLRRKVLSFALATSASPES